MLVFIIFYLFSAIFSCLYHVYNLRLKYLGILTYVLSDYHPIKFQRSLIRNQKSILQGRHPSPSKSSPLGEAAA